MSKRKEKACFSQHIVTVELDTSSKVLLLINSIFIVTKIQKRPKKLHHSFSEEYFPDSTVQIFFAKSSKGTSPISIVKPLTEAETLGDFFLWYLLLSAGFHPCPTSWRQRVQPGGQWEWWDGGCVLAGDKLPTNHFQVSHQQLMLSDCRCTETSLLLMQNYVFAPSQLQFTNHQDARAFCSISRALYISPS